MFGVALPASFQAGIIECFMCLIEAGGNVGDSWHNEHTRGCTTEGQNAGAVP